MRISGALLAFLLATASAPGAGERAPIKVEYPQQGMTLRIISRCPAGTECPFTAEVDAPAATFARIRKVDYTWVPGRSASPAPVTDARTRFRIEGVQHEGGLVYAMVTLDGTKSPVLLQGDVPFSSPVRPALPAGLRFEVRYSAEVLEGGVATGYHRYRVWLRGDAAAMKTIRSVVYSVPPEFGMGSRQASSIAEHFFEGGSASQPFDIKATIRWTNGKKTTYAIPFEPR